jgi:translin
MRREFVPMNIEEAEKEVLEREGKLDEYLREERGVVRLCARSIKEVHRGNLDEAEKLAGQAKEAMGALPEIEGRGRHVEQEYAEAAALISVVEGGEIADYAKMGVGAEGYILGLSDAIGELKRLVLESLRRGEEGKARQYFERMEGIYDGIGHLHFSSAALPEFRRKQDVARLQVEEARGKLIRAGK